LVKASTVQSGTTPSFGQPTGTGNLLVMLIESGSPTQTVTNDPAWAKAVGNLATDIWYKPNSAASETAPILGTFSSHIILLEFSGAATASPLDQKVLVTGAAGVTPVTATCPGADANSGSLICSVNQTVLSKSATHTSSETYNNGATATLLANDDASSTTTHYRFGYGVTTGNSAADSDTVATDSMNLTSIRVAIASFKPAGAAPPAPQPKPVLVMTAVSRAAVR